MPADPGVASSSGRADARLAALFPEPGSVQADPRRRRRRNALVGGLVVIALVLAIAGVSAAFGSSGGSYRTAVAGPHQVASLLTGVATIEPVSQATVAFPVAGTVSTVNVRVGDAVAAGGVLASLDTQSLEQALHAKQASLAQAQLNLEKALSGQSVGSTSSGSGGSGSFGGSAASGSSGTAATTSAALRGTVPATAVLATSVTPATAPGGSGGSGGSGSGGFSTDPAIAAAQHAVLAAQQQVDAALEHADAAVAAVRTACAAFLGGGTTTTATTAPPDATACQAAIAAAQQAQQALAQDQQSLADASNALNALLDQQATTPPTTTTTTPARPSSGSSGSTGAAAGGSAGSASRATTGSSPTAADLVASQASVDAATYAVAAAQQAVDAATMTSPIAGTVVGVSLQAGQSVAADSSTGNVVVQGHGGYEISTSVSVDSLGSVAVGQSANVVPDGSHQALPGKVVAIGVVPASTTTTATLYHVIVGLANPDAPLHDGATGTVAIVTKQAHASLAVPTSAVATRGTRHSVTVLQGGTPTEVVVQTGVMGSDWTEITSGLEAGDEVVLADVGAPLPGSATASTGTTGTTNQNRFGGFGGGFPGGGFAGGGGGRG